MVDGVSFQAVTWAIEQRAGSPSAKATLWSIANYANENWCAWPSQKKICEDSEQSPDAVQKRLPDLVSRGLIRRVPLMFSGRKTVDFIILRPSPLFDAAIEDIEPHLPRGCTVDVRRVAAISGSDNTATVGEGADDSDAADSGVDAADSGNALPQTMPQIAATVAALERQQEPVNEPLEPRERECARARSEKRHHVSAFLKRWPSAAVDSQEAIKREWAALPDDELQPAIDGIEQFCAELKKHKRSHLPSGATYLRERKWKGLPPPGQVPQSQKIVSFPVWSRDWWAMIFAMADRGESIKFRVDHAKERGTREVSERADRMPPAEVVAGLTAVKATGEWLANWRPWFTARGVNLPFWTESVWVFLPGPFPPERGGKALDGCLREREQDQSDEFMEANQ